MAHQVKIVKIVGPGAPRNTHIKRLFLSYIKKLRVKVKYKIITQAKDAINNI